MSGPLYLMLFLFTTQSPMKRSWISRKISVWCAHLGIRNDLPIPIFMPIIGCNQNTKKNKKWFYQCLLHRAHILLRLPYQKMIPIMTRNFSSGLLNRSFKLKLSHLLYFRLITAKHIKGEILLLKRLAVSSIIWCFFFIGRQSKQLLIEHTYTE